MTKAKRKEFGIFELISLIILFLYSVSLLLPFFWSLITSLKDKLDYLINPLGFPKQIVNNYATVLEYFKVPLKGGVEFAGIGEMVFNSLWYALGGALMLTAVSLIVGYVCASYNFKFCGIIYSVIIITMIIPTVGTLASEVRLASSLGLYDTWYGMILMKGYVTGLYFLTFYASVKLIPKDYREAAVIDGAGNLKVMTRIIFPMVKGTITTVILLNFISLWNDYQTPLIYMPSYPTIAYGLYFYVNGSYEQLTSTVPMKMAGCMIVAIPLFILFIVGQKKLLGNISVGGLK